MIKIYLLLVFIISYTSYFAQTTNVFKTESPVYVTADLHGTYDEVLTTLKLSGLINDNNTWSAGNSHFVNLGDLSNSGNSSRKIMELFMRLQSQADESGGGFHILLAEQQIRSLRGEWHHLSSDEISAFSEEETKQQRQDAYQQYIHWNKIEDNPESLNEFNKIYPPGLFARMHAFGLTGKFGKWLINLPFMIKINDQLFIHGGLSNRLQNSDIDELNTQLQSDLTDYMESRNYFLQENILFFDLPFKERKAIINKVKQSQQQQQFLKSHKSRAFSIFGPSLYRGNSICHSFFEQDSLQKQLKKRKSTRLWTGRSNTQNNAVQSNFAGQLLIMNTEIKTNSSNQSRQHPWIAKIDQNNKISYSRGKTVQTIIPESIKDREFRNPLNMSDKEVEDFLLTAQITHKKNTKEGRTRPFKVTLEKNGIKIHGIFKYKDSKPNAHQGRWSSSINETDRYQYEVAAYKLDRMLNIGLVPVTVIRTIDERTGVLQVWIEGLISQLKMVENNIMYKGSCDLQAQVNMMNTFDFLIANRDRNQSNLMFSKNDWQIWFIDHSRSFSVSRKLNKSFKKLKIKPTATFIKALDTLTLEQLDSLKPWLHPKQIDGIWKRRGKIIRNKI